MIARELLAHPLVERLGWGLLHFLWVGSAIAMLLAIALWAMRNRSPQARYQASWLALLAMLVAVPAIASLVTPAPRVVKAEVQASAAIDPFAPLPIEFDETRPPAMPRDFVAPLEIASDPPVVPVSLFDRVTRALRPSLPWLVGGWLVGSLAIAIWHMGGWWQLGRLRRIGTTEAPREMQLMLAKLLDRFPVPRPVKLLTSRRVAVPMLIGWLRPVILVPVSVLAELPAQHLELILAHELAHLRRCDFLLNLVQTAIETLLFYHPAVWWVSRQIRIERENCCDDLVAATSDRMSYARALAALADLCGRPSHARPDLSLGADGGSLLARIRRLVGRQRKTGFPSAHTGGAILALIALLAVAVGSRLIAQPDHDEPANSTPTIEAATELTPKNDPSTAVVIGPAVVVSGKIVDDETGRPVENFVIQHGKVDESDPRKTIWVLNETRTSAPAPEGKFQFEFQQSKVYWPARVLAAGYLPQSVLEKAPESGVTKLENREVRLKRGREIAGRVLYHDGAPAIGMSVFLAGNRRVNISQGKALLGLTDFVDPTVTKATTDADGRFKLTGAGSDVNTVVVSGARFDFWAVPAPIMSPDFAIKLPQPGRLIIRYDIAGAPAMGEFFATLRASEMPGWPAAPGFDGLENTRTSMVANGGQLILDNIAPGQFELVRSKTPYLCDRRTIAVKSGKTAASDFVRQRGSSVKGRIAGLPNDVLVAWNSKHGGIIRVAPADGIRDPNTPLLDAQTFGADGTFQTERLVPGRYAIVVTAYRDPAEMLMPPKFHSNAIVSIGQAEVIVPDEGALPPVTIECRPHEPKNEGAAGQSDPESTPKQPNAVPKTGMKGSENMTPSVVVSASGRVVDDITGLPVELFRIQGGRTDDKDPTKIIWGWSESRGDAPRKDGRFDAHHFRPAHGEWPGRILAAGYLPQPILEKAPAEGVTEIKDHVVRLKRGRAIAGRVVDREGKSVAKASVFLVGNNRSAHITAGRVEDGPLIDRHEDPTVTKATTDDAGRFKLTGAGGDASTVVVSAPRLDIWATPAPDAKVDDFTIALPQPGKLIIRYDIAGGEDSAKFLLQLQEPAWAGANNIRIPVVANGGQLVLDNVTPGQYQLFRGKSDLHYPCDRRIVTIEAGKTVTSDFVRAAGSPVRGQIVGLTKEMLGDRGGAAKPGAVIIVRSANDPEETSPSFDGLTCGADGKFQTEKLLPGKYAIEVHAFESLPKEGTVVTGIQRPSFIGSAEVTVPEEGIPPVVSVEIRRRDVKTSGQPKEAAMVTVAGRVVDDQTGQPVERFVIHGGHVDSQDPTKITWGGYEMRREPWPGGKFDMHFRRGSDGWPSRILAAGYLPQPILEKAPATGVTRIADHVVRLKRGREIVGRVVDHDGKPAAEMSVFLLDKGRNVNFGGGKAGQHRGGMSEMNEDLTVTKTIADAAGRFKLTGASDDAQMIVVSGPRFDVWAVPAPDAKSADFTIQLPQPGRLIIRYDIAGSEPKGKFLMRLRSREMPGWTETHNIQYRTVTNGGQLVLDNVTPGQYDLTRVKAESPYRSDRAKDELLDWFGLCDQRTVTVEGGKTVATDFMRLRGSLVRGQINGLTKEMFPDPWSSSSGATIIVRSAAEDPQGKFPVFDGQICGADGKFQTEKLLPGKYAIVVQAFHSEPRAEGGATRLGFRPLSFLGSTEVTVPDDRAPPPVTIEIQPQKDMTSIEPKKAVPVSGRVVDDETGQPVERFVIQGGQADRNDPTKFTWGFYEMRSDAPSPGGAFDVNFQQGSDRWPSRILAAGYLPQPILEKAPAANVTRIADHVVRLKRGREIVGRVVDHDGKPAADMSVFLVDHARSVNVGGGKAGPVGSEMKDDLTVTNATTDADGRFKLTGGGGDQTIVVSGPRFDAWAVPAPDAKGTDFTVKLPKPGRLIIRYDIAGSEPEAKFLMQLRSWEMPGWKGAQNIHYRTVTNGGQLVLDNVPPGQYELTRAKAETPYRSDLCDRRTVTVEAGKTVTTDFVRLRGSPVRGQINGLTKEMLIDPWNSNSGAIVIVRSAADDPQGKLPIFDAQTCGPDGKFQTEKLLPGKYAIDVQAFRADVPRADGLFRFGLRGPSFFGRAVVTVPDDGAPPAVTIEIRPHETKKQNAVESSQRPLPANDVASAPHGPVTIDTIAAAWRARELRIKSLPLRFQWSEKRTDMESAKGSDPMAADFKSVFTADGSKFRYDWSVTAGTASVASMTVTSRDGVVKTLTQYGPNKNATGLIWDSSRNVLDFPIRVMSIGISPSNAGLTEIDLSKYALRADRRTIDGVSCYVLERKDGNSVETELYLHPNNEFLVRRIVGKSGVTIGRQVDYEYANVDKLGWMPRSWQIVLMDKATGATTIRLVTRDGDVSVINTPHESTFDIVFPFGAAVRKLRDGASEYFIAGENGSLNPYSKVAGPWGPAADGIQVRLRADKAVWMLGEIPTFKADVRNTGSSDRLFAQSQQLSTLLIDGVVYRWAADIDVKTSPLPPGMEYQNILVRCIDSWRSSKDNSPLKLSAGKHRMQWVTDVAPADPKVAQPVKAISNPIEFEVVMEDSKAPQDASFAEKVERILSLSKAPRTSDTAKLPDLWEERPARSKSYELRAGTIVGRHPKEIAFGDFYYLPAKDVFYVQHDALASSTLTYYGPFKGKPQEILGVPDMRQSRIEPWGAAADGIEVRLRADKTVWKVGEAPAFKAEMRNVGAAERWVSPSARLGKLIVDGVEYAQTIGFIKQDEGTQALPPGKHRQDIPVMSNTWENFKTHAAPKWSIGKHQVQFVTIVASRANTFQVPEIRAVSNPVEIEIVADAGKDDASQWGDSVDGLQLRLRTNKAVWKDREVPQLNYDLRNTGSATRHIIYSQQFGLLEFDGVEYYPNFGAGDFQYFPDQSGSGNNKMPLSLGGGWHRVKDHAPLKLSAGKHILRVMATASPVGPKDGKLPAGKDNPPRALSNPVEIEILPRESNDSKEKTLEEFNEALREHLRDAKPEHSVDLTLPPERAAGYAIGVGDFVDVLFRKRLAKKDGKFETIAAGLKVAATRRDKTGTVTFTLTPNAAQTALILAAEKDGELALAVSVPSDRNRFSDARLKDWSFPESLTSLVMRGPKNFGASRITQAGIEALPRFVNLKTLVAGGLGLTDAAFEPIGKLSNLETLQLPINDFRGTEFRHLANLKKLRRLTVHFGPDAEGFAEIAKLTEMVELETGGFPIDDAILEQCARLTKLERLRIPAQIPTITDAGLGHLAAIKGLTNFELLHAPLVTDAGLEQIGTLSKMADLRLFGLPRVSANGLTMLRHLKELRSLEINEIAMNDASLRALADHSRLENLLLWGIDRREPLGPEMFAGLDSLRMFRTTCRLSPEAIRALGNLKNLESIKDELHDITDEDLKHLARLPKLEWLALDSDRITAASLPTLAKMTSLRTLYIGENVRISPDELTKLGETSLPACRIGRYRPPYTVFYAPPADRPKRTIVGRVLDRPGGKTVAGVEVAMWHTGGEKRQVVRTDGDGNYSMPVTISNDDYIFRVGNAPGTWVEGIRVLARDASGGDIRADDLYQSRPQSVAGAVRDEQGRPVPGVQIHFSTEDAPRNYDSIRTDAKGEFQLDVVPRTVEIQCTGNSDRYYPTTAERKSINVAANQHVIAVDFTVRSAPQFTGEVRLPDGKPASGVEVDVKVWWSGNPKEGDGGTMRGANGLGTTFKLRTDDQGRFIGHLRRPIEAKWQETIVLTAVARSADGRLVGETRRETRTDADPPVDMKLVLADSAAKDSWTLDVKFDTLKRMKLEIPGRGERTIYSIEYEVSNPTKLPRQFSPILDMTTDKNEKEVVDEILPVAQDKIGGDRENSFSVRTAPIPPGGKVRAVAFWNGIDPEAKQFTISLRGLSNDFKIANGKASPKTLQMRYEIPAERREIRPRGAPEWVYGAK